MKNLKYSLLVVVMVAFAFSCADESLDPLQFEKIKKGTILALRGTQLTNIYSKGIPGALFVPGIATGAEKFEFDAELLADDPTTLASIDVYAIKKVGTTRERKLLKNIPASSFKTTTDYAHPWVTVSLGLSEILTAIGVTPNYPLNSTALNTLFVTYKTGIAIETDINLVDGTKVVADDIINSGLFASNQFYPAQRLNYTVVKYCQEDLAGTYSYKTVVKAVGAGGDISGCDPAGVTGTGELKKLAGAYGTYSITDATFGQYDCAWADNPATGVTLINTCDEISTGGADQYALIYTFTNIKVSADGKDLSFDWENDYGDKGSTVLTRTDSKLWPLTLK